MPSAVHSMGRPRHPVVVAPPSGHDRARPTPVELPPKSPERLAEIRAPHERIGQGHESGTVAWEEVAEELGLPSSS
jgi:hypothetical protein